LADRLLDGVNRIFLSDPSPIETISAALECMRVRKKAWLQEFIIFQYNNTSSYIHT
jgi:hypothetical protein